MAAEPPLTPDDLKAALVRDELFLHYQPQIASDDSVASVEALVRWHHPTIGSVPADRFSTLAEKCGLIGDLGAWVMRRACRDAARWPRIGVGVNVSPLQFRRPDFVDFVTEVATEAGLPFARLEIEITESAYFDDPDHAEAEIERLRGLGIKVALDDFGTGYSSLSYLRRLNFDKLKIDKNFVNDTTSMRGAAIVHAVIALARALGLKVTAEGVETLAQQRFLRTAGCHYLQGYLYSKPVEAEAITRMLEAGPFRPGRTG